MSNASLVNIQKLDVGELSKPATVLIERISDAVGEILQPYQMVRKAKAQAEVDKIKTASRIELTDLQMRAVNRWIREETNKQENIERITQKALPLLEKGARPEDIERDWFVNFFDKARLISDAGMQDLWSRILSGEANAPGSFRRRTVNFVASLDKHDASLFNTLTSFVWQLEEGLNNALVFDPDADIYKGHDITFGALTHLDTIGLITFNHITGFTYTVPLNKVTVFYNRRPLTLSFTGEKDNVLPIGKVLLTDIGRELLRVCDAKKIDGFVEYVAAEWNSEGVTTL